MINRDGSVSAAEGRMGYSPGPTPDRRPGDGDRPAVLIGHPPVVLMHRARSPRWARVDDVIDRLSLMVVFVLWVVVPILGALSLALR
jgi:hypothetical protein